MSITYCHNCNKNIDTDFDATHIEDCLEESKEETHSLKPLRQDREILLSKKKIKTVLLFCFLYTKLVSGMGVIEILQRILQRK